MQRFTCAVIMAVLYCCLSVGARGQVANFTVDDSSGCAPLVVHFTNTTGCASCTYTWSLTSTATSTLTDVSASYVTPGTYTVTLTANNGGSTTVHTSTVTVFPTPTVGFAADDTSVCPGVPVNFTSSSTGGVPGPLIYSWNFGDGDSSSVTSPSHPFGFPGNYNITLSVTNAEGCVNALTRSGYIHVFNKPVSNFTGSPTNVCTAPVTVNFSNTSSGTGLTYNWSFGDGGSSTSVSPPHNYTMAGTYTVKLRTTNSDGCIDSFIRPGYIHIGDLAASFTAPATGCVGTGVTFNNTSTPHAWSSWNFGDASGSTLESPVHVFTAVGTYTVSMVVSDGPCFSTATRTITIYPVPTGTFTITPDHPCPAPQTLSYNSTVTPGASVSWKFFGVDSGSTAGLTAAHSFIYNQIYEVQMTITTPQGCSYVVSQTDTIYNLFILPGHGCDTLAANFGVEVLTSIGPPIPSHPYPYEPYTYSWSYGDGASGTGPNPVHIYSAVGTYVSTVTVTTANGCTRTATDTLTPVLSQATFTAAPARICYGDSVLFTPSTVLGPIEEYIWYYGDGGSKTFPGVNWHTYGHPGEFVVTVIPTHNGCLGRRFVTTDTVVVDSPMANIEFAYSCINKDRVAFFDTVSLGANSHMWLFGDGDSSTATNPVHTYPGTGYYTAFLCTFNSASGCRDTTNKTVRVIRLHPDFAAQDSAVCRDDTVQINSTVTDSPLVTASLYEWYVDGVLQPDATHATFIDTVRTKGIFTIGIVTTDAHNCRDTLIKPYYLHVAKPAARFGANKIGCAPLIANFVDSTTDIPGTFFTKYAWDFGDTYTDTSLVPTIAHTYRAGGTYSVREIVTDNIGCKDTVTRSSYIRVLKPFAFFYADNVHACAGAPVSFTNMTAGVVSAFWLFGDGGSSPAISPVHVYTAEGSYPVRLAVIDSFGCTDTTTYNAYINITKPQASFTMSDSFNVCAPMPVNFTSTGHGATNFAWTFGDGNASVVPSPSNIYVASGFYNVKLIVTDAYGCKDTAIKHATVYGFAGAFSYTPVSGCSPLSVHFSAALTGSIASTMWDFADGVIVSGALDTITHVYTSPGAYIPKLILSDSSGCTNFSAGLDTIKVSTVNAAFKTIPNKVCVGGSISFVDSTISWFSPVYTRSWSLDGTTSTLTSPTHTFTNSGTFPVTLTATNSQGCTSTITKTVTINPLPVVTAGPDTIACAGTSTKLFVSGAATYTWSGGPLSCTTCDTTLAAPAITTTYSVTGVDTNGCVNRDTARVTILSAVASGGGAICPGSTLTLSNLGSGMWSSADVSIATIAPVAGVVTGVAPGTVMMSYTLPAGCYALVMVTVKAVPGPIVVPAGICAGTADTLTDTFGGGTWSMTTGAVANINATSGIVNGLAAGTAAVTYTISSGCSTITVVTVNPMPGPITGSVPMCIGGAITVADTLAGGTWQSADTATATISNTGLVTGMSSGTTTITYDRAGCTANAVVTVEITPDAGIISGPTVLCIGGTITLNDTATGTWSSKNTSVATIGSASGVVNGLRVGSDTVMYTTPTNSAGCFDTAMYIIAVDSPSFNIIESVTNVACHGGQDGRISVVIDELKPYAYVWSNGGDSTTVDSLAVGTYSLTVTSTGDQCHKAESYTITQPDLLVVTAETTPDSCLAGSGRITLTANGGISPYLYTWSNSAVTPDVTGLMPGTYTVMVTDMHNCAVHVAAVVAEDSCFEVFIYDVITPNGDGVNDVWVIQGLEHYPQNIVQIFDKWGDLVYEKGNYSNEWRGQGRGETLLPDGTYFYLVKLNAPNRTGGESVFKGTVLIKR